jgi:hypothetical protein
MCRGRYNGCLGTLEVDVGGAVGAAAEISALHVH